MSTVIGDTKLKLQENMNKAILLQSENCPLTTALKKKEHHLWIKTSTGPQTPPLRAEAAEGENPRSNCFARPCTNAKEVISVARCAAFKVCRARRRSGAYSLKCTSICVSTGSCHHFCFVHAESISSNSLLQTQPVLQHSNGAFRRQSTRFLPARAKIW